MRVPRGCASCLGVGHPGSGALPAPTTRPLGRAAGAYYPLAVGAGGADPGTRHQPHSARSCLLAWRAVGAARGRPGGGPLAWVLGVRGRALSHPRPLVLSGVRPGPTTHWLWMRGVRAWRPVTNPTARALASWRCALWERHEGARGGGPFCLAVGCPGSGALPPATTRLFGRAAGAHYPLALGAGGAGVGTRQQLHSARSCDLALRAVGAACGCPGGAPLAWVWGVRGQALSHPRPLVFFRACGRGPLPTCCRCGGCRQGTRHQPHSALLRAGFARCGRGMRVPGGGHLLPGCRASGVGRSPTPEHSSFWACDRGPLPTGCGCRGVRAWEPVTIPTARPGLARCGGGTRAPGKGASCLGAGCPGSGALPPPTTRPFRRATGALYPLAVDAGGADVGTRHQPHSARFCELALRAVEAACGCPGGAPLAWVWGVRGPALSHPRPLLLLGVQPGPTTDLMWVRGVRAWGPVTNPTACALASWLCALWGRHEGAWGGCLLPGFGASGVRRSPTPDHLSFRACSWGPLPTGFGCEGCGRGDPSPTPQCALLRAGFACCGGAMRVPGGRASCLGVGRSGSSAS